MRVLYEGVKTILGMEKYGASWRIRRRMPLKELAKMVKVNLTKLGL